MVRCFAFLMCPLTSTAEVRSLMLPCRALKTRFGGHGSLPQRSWSCTTCAFYQYSCMVWTAGQYQRWAPRIDVLDQWCLRMLLGIKWYQFVWNDDVRWLTKQPKLTAIIQSRRLTLFGHIMRMDDNTDAKRILVASPPVDWRRHPGRPRITWLSTVQQDLKQHHIMLPEAADLAQNHPLWRMMSTYGATQSWVACQKRQRRRLEG